MSEACKRGVQERRAREAYNFDGAWVEHEFYYLAVLGLDSAMTCFSSARPYDTPEVSGTRVLLLGRTWPYSLHSRMRTEIW